MNWKKKLKKKFLIRKFERSNRGKIEATKLSELAKDISLERVKK